MSDGLRWAVLGTANIARRQLLPALAEAGGRAVVVGGRDPARTRAYATENGIERAVEGYRAVVEDPEVDVVYVALPNSLHAEWTVAALQAGKAVLCEKPLCSSVADTRAVVEEAERAGVPLWESFVFPWHDQFARVRQLLADGAIGDLREIVSSFHFLLGDGPNIRLSAELGGGALADVGCYPIRLANLLFADPAGPGCLSAVTDGRVEVDAAAVLEYPGGRRLGFTCGFRRAYDTSTRLLGTTGSLTIDNPFHPGPTDTVLVSTAGRAPFVERPTRDQRSFSGAVRHITSVVRGEQAASHLATTDSPATAEAVEGLQQQVAKQTAAVPLGG